MRCEFEDKVKDDHSKEGTKKPYNDSEMEVMSSFEQRSLLKK